MAAYPPRPSALAATKACSLWNRCCARDAATNHQHHSVCAHDETHPQCPEQVMACGVPWHKSCMTCASCRKVCKVAIIMFLGPVMNQLTGTRLPNRCCCLCNISQSLDSTNLCDKILENGKQVLNSWHPHASLACAILASPSSRRSSASRVTPRHSAPRATASAAVQVHCK